jgi:hypothetical protein
MNTKRIAIRVAYWLAVVAVSIALVLALVLLFESLDSSDVDSGGGTVPALPLKLL